MSHYNVPTKEFGNVFMMDDTPYPYAIVPARYGGVYEGASVLAFPTEPTALPDGWDGGDTECHAYWSANATAPIGKGETPDAALADLRAKLLKLDPA